MFHVHTYRCGHASDEKEIDYIEKAIQLGAKHIVFTDHCPFPGDSFRMRMKMKELPDYVQTLRDLQERYANDIDIRIGLEAEYIPDYKSYYEELLGSYALDVLLLGQHFTKLPDGRYSFELTDKSDEAKFLADGMNQGMESGFFTVVAHPDQIFRRFKIWDVSAANIAKDIIAGGLKNQVIFEKNIDNMMAYPRHRRYWPEFWQLCSSEIKTIYGLDAHSVEALEKYYLKKLVL